ncbi:hypothetical protein BWO91_14920 [Plantibacter flavus]|uniref:hypothetical protein n=1 Tax=Plantibacter flavus TaxID=150123 RepID=UPI00099BC443|nr:hypothetical protein [Plantibacter flavus]AQX81090.1 hypothetical protein BWO91_14920 [Plantibacter flavus]
MSTRTSYTVKLTDGPLEGKTISARLSDHGSPTPTVDVPSGTAGKVYRYARTTGEEYDDSGAPSAVDYRFLEAVFTTGSSQD